MQTAQAAEAEAAILSRLVKPNRADLSPSAAERPTSCWDYAIRRPYRRNYFEE